MMEVEQNIEATSRVHDWLLLEARKGAKRSTTSVCMLCMFLYAYARTYHTCVQGKIKRGRRLFSTHVLHDHPSVLDHTSSLRRLN